MNTKANFSALDAALKVLQEAGSPLHYQEITQRVLAAGLWKTEGKTPDATINARLAVDVKKNGPSSAFRRAGRGVFALNTERTDQPPHAPVGMRPEDKQKNPRQGARLLVLGYLERIASSAFAEFPRQITDLAHSKHGVYALYKGDRLYYVGLATNLRNRIKQHLHDKHAGKWNRFSLYLVRKVEHIKELESMILRIADPTGNSTRGGLPGAENLWGELHATIREEQDRQIRKIFDIKTKTRRPKPIPRKSHTEKPRSNKRTPALAPFLAQNIKQLRGRHMKQTLTAQLNADGTLDFNGKRYNSPSVAGAAAVKRKTCNGWTFWEYERAPGDWVKINVLRK